ncbi:MAG: DUF3048 domain-containing protein [bacterium]
MAEEKPKKKSKIKEFFKKLGEDRRLQIYVSVAVLVIVVAVTWGIVIAVNDKDDDDVKISSKKVVEEDVNINERRLDGMIVAPEDANKWPVAIMIENLIAARPQAGLIDAQLVYETLAESGITRFMTIFSGDMPDKIGPVRSSRRYYLEWAQPLDPVYAHAGGSPQALEHISAFGIKNLNAIASAAAYFWRGEGSAPHNLYTSWEKMTFAVRDKELTNATPEYTKWLFKDATEDLPTEEKTIDIEFSSATYNVHYEYDSATNDYKRFHSDTPHTDRNTGNQIKVKNVVIQKVPAEVGLSEKGRIDLDLHGTGEAILCSDGVCEQGTWSKPDLDTRTVFTGAGGEEYEFTRGNIWVEVVPGERNVNYTELQATE